MAWMCEKEFTPDSIAAPSDISARWYVLNAREPWWARQEPDVLRWWLDGDVVSLGVRRLAHWSFEPPVQLFGGG